MGANKEVPMPTTLDDVAEALQIVLTSTANTAAWNTGFVRRRSKLTGAAFVQALTFGWLSNPRATLEELAQTAATVGVAISPQGLDQRFTPQAAACLLEVLRAAVARVFAADPVAVPILQRFPGGVDLLDSTTIALPDRLASLWPSCTSQTAAKGRAALKLQVRLDLLHGTLHGPIVEAGRSSDRSASLGQVPLPKGALRLADLGYFRVGRLRELSDQEVYWLTRIQPRTALYDGTGCRQSIATLLEGRTEDVVDVPMQMGHTERLPCRVLAVRVPPAVAATRRKRLLKVIHRRKRQTHPDCWTLTEWTVYATNVPAAMLTVAEAQVLARCRWQIELLFKLWKQHGQVDESCSSQPWRVLCEVYAKLLGMVVQHWVLLVSCWSYADRSLAKASATVRRHALNLAVVLGQRQLVCRALAVIQRCLRKGCRINRRQKEPPTFQLLLNLTEGGQIG
jgi:hypothetical protein